MRAEKIHRAQIKMIKITTEGKECELKAVAKYNYLGVEITKWINVWEALDLDTKICQKNSKKIYKTIIRPCI